MNLYHKLPLRKFDKKTEIIIKIAQKLERTPGSIAMKLGNLASLDPNLKERGKQGLKNASRADREIWQEFTENWEQLVEESEVKFQKLLKKDEDQQQEQEISQIEPNGLTEVEIITKVRRKQSFFRQMILANYNNLCCVTGNPIPELLIASHILPWGKYPEYRLNPDNGLCLARTHDVAFDRGLITFDEDYRLILSPYLESFLPNETLEHDFVSYAGKKIHLPEKVDPNPHFLQIHREEIFRKTK